MKPGDVLTLRLKILPHEVPAELRVRRALKCLLRSFGLKNDGIMLDEKREVEEMVDGDPS